MPEEVQQTTQVPQGQQAALSENAARPVLRYRHPRDRFPGGGALQPDPKVRFHAWQSIFLCAAWVAAWVVLTMIGFVPIVHLIDIVLVPLVWLGFMILWLVVMINGFMGKTIRVPVLGALAAKQAGL